VTQGEEVLFFSQRKKERKKQENKAAQSWEARACLQREDKAALCLRHRLLDFVRFRQQLSASPVFSEARLNE
jgi:hypothetical protein